MIKTTEAQYAEINEKVANNRIAADQLDKTYLGKFKKILSSKKIFSCNVQRCVFTANDKRYES